MDLRFSGETAPGQAILLFKCYGRVKLHILNGGAAPRSSDHQV
jgi:hypothetical protein